MTERVIRFCGSGNEAKAYARTHDGLYFRPWHVSAKQHLDFFKSGRVNLLTVGPAAAAAHGWNLDIDGPCKIEFSDSYPQELRPQAAGRLHRNCRPETVSTVFDITSEGMRAGEIQMIGGATKAGTPVDHEERMAELAERMGLHYEPIPDPSEQLSMDDPKVVERMEHVVKYATDRYSELNDFTVGNIVRMLMRNSMDHEAIVCAARDRIFKLSLELKAAKARIQELEARLK